MRVNTIFIAASIGLAVAVGSCGSQSGGDNQPRPASAVTASCPGGEPGPDEVAVLSAVIDGLYGEGAQSYVVTTEMATANDQAMAAQTDPPIDRGALDDLRKKNAAPSCFQAAPPAGKPVRMIAESDANAFFKDGPEKGWPEFDAKHPGAQGIMKLSRVGFSADGTEAVLFVSNVKAALNAEGVIVVLRKQGGAWTVAKKHVLWIA